MAETSDVIDIQPRLKTFDVLAGGSEMGARTRVFNWSASPLGSIEDWPQSLRSVLSICLVQVSNSLVSGRGLAFCTTIPGLTHGNLCDWGALETEDDSR